MRVRGLWFDLSRVGQGRLREIETYELLCTLSH